MVAPGWLARPLSLAIALIAVGLAPTIPLAAADGDVVAQERYVGGLSTSAHMPVPEHHKAAVCTDEANVGGVCNLTVPTETKLVVLVDDTALDRVPFHWRSHTPSGETGGCPGGHTIGEDDVSLPDGCSRIDVHVSAPAAEGTVTIKHGEAVIY